MDDYSKYTKEQLVSLLEYIDRPVETFSEACVRMCEILSCDNCPVVIYNCDHRTEEDRCLLHEPCYTQLYNWAVKEAKKIKEV